MPEIITQFTLTPGNILLFFLSALLIGMAKAGISGVGLLVVPILAGIFGGKPSTGILLPMLIMADIFAVLYYHRHAEWKHIVRLLPFAIIGIFIALLIGNYVTGKVFNIILS
ncbi:TSUP family transporter, partial [Bacteroidota bacterium]